MLAIAGTMRPLMNTDGVEFTSRDSPSLIDFLMRASVSDVAAQAEIFCASRPAAVASSLSLSSAVAKAIPPWFSKMLLIYFQKASWLVCAAQSAYCAAFMAHGCNVAGNGNC